MLWVVVLIILILLLYVVAKKLGTRIASGTFLAKWKATRSRRERVVLLPYLVVHGHTNKFTYPVNVTGDHV